WQSGPLLASTTTLAAVPSGGGGGLSLITSHSVTEHSPLPEGTYSAFTTRNTWELRSESIRSMLLDAGSGRVFCATLCRSLFSSVSCCRTSSAIACFTSAVSTTWPLAATGTAGALG